jgi:hypothetical protein
VQLVVMEKVAPCVVHNNLISGHKTLSPYFDQICIDYIISHMCACAHLAKHNKGWVLPCEPTVESIDIGFACTYVMQAQNNW